MNKVASKRALQSQAFILAYKMIGKSAPKVRKESTDEVSKPSPNGTLNETKDSRELARNGEGAINEKPK